MKTYTYQIGEGPGDDITKLMYVEEILADGLSDAVDKAKAITRLRPDHVNETTACVSWIKSVAHIRAG